MTASPAVSVLLEQSGAQEPGRVAVRDADGSELTYDELVRSGRRIGRHLLGLGLVSGDRVAMWLDDSIAYVEAYVACALAGLVVVPVNARLTPHEAHHIVSDSGARVLLHSRTTRERALVLARELAELQLVAVDGPDPLCALAAGETDDPLPPRAADEPYVIGYTSGTTGPPKGAVLTQGSVASIARMNARTYRLPHGSIAAMTGSMSFVAVVPAHIMSHFYVGGTVQFLGAWSPDTLVDQIERCGATFVYVPSPLMDEVSRAFAAEPQRWASLQTVLHSASKVSEDKLARLAAVVGSRLVEGWGMTENSGGLMTATTPEDAQPGSGRLASVGRAVPEVDIDVLAEDGSSLPHDGQRVGELAFRSPAMMAGYWRRPEATAAAIVDGWHRTGDLGTIDPDGYVTLVERRVDLIVSGGMNVYPFEVEQALQSHPDVQEACVVGLPHARWGQGVAAAVVLASGAAEDEAALLRHCREFLASYKLPTRIAFVPELPRTSSLKVSRRAVRDDLA